MGGVGSPHVTNYARLAVSHGSDIEIQSYSSILCSPPSHASLYLDLAHDLSIVKRRDDTLLESWKPITKSTLHRNATEIFPTSFAGYITR